MTDQLLLIFLAWLCGAASGVLILLLLPRKVPSMSATVASLQASIDQLTAALGLIGDKLTKLEGQVATMPATQAQLDTLGTNLAAAATAAQALAGMPPPTPMPTPAPGPVPVPPAA